MPRVLIIDDESVIVLILQEVLSDAGYEVVTALNGLQGLELLKQDPLPDLIIIDLLMPVMGGREFLKTIQSQTALQQIPVILTSGSIPNEKDFPPAGSYQDVISKPFDINIVVEKVQRLLER